MKKYYIKLKNGDKKSLLKAVSTHLKINKIESEKVIKQGSVWIDNKRIKDIDKVITEELIIIYFPEKPIIEYSLKKENIKYEDEFLMIVFKEQNVNSCPSPMADVDCILYGVNKYYKELNLDYEASNINRLDNPTSGLLFFAKSKKLETDLHNLFRLRNIKKLYLAATPRFELKKNSILINDILDWKGKSQEASSYIKFLKEKDDFFYFMVYPLTGRTHQIRKHFQKYLIPIHGDCLYGNYNIKERLKLTCFYYKFRHPITKKIITVNESDEQNCLS